MLGTLREVTGALGNSNIAPDGSGPHGYGERLGTGVFFGPGMVLEVPFTEVRRAAVFRGFPEPAHPGQ